MGGHVIVVLPRESSGNNDTLNSGVTKQLNNTTGTNGSSYTNKNLVTANAQIPIAQLFMGTAHHRHSLLPVLTYTFAFYYHVLILFHYVVTIKQIQEQSGANVQKWQYR